MGANSNIQWTTNTWNPWRGCDKVSPGCAHCYMFRDEPRYGRDPSVVVRAAQATFDEPLKWERRIVAHSGGVLLEPTYVFTCSLSDFFHPKADAWRADAWHVIRQTPRLTYQMLTKRPERLRECLPPDWGERGYPNVWLGTSVELQRWAVRVLDLLRVPAAVHFVSAEPLLGPLDLTRVRAPNGALVNALTGDVMTPEGEIYAGVPHGAVDWVICGGESGGREARPFDARWAKSLYMQCDASRAAFFMKQTGSVWARAHGAKHPHGGDPDEWGHDVPAVCQMPTGAWAVQRAAIAAMAAPRQGVLV